MWTSQRPAVGSSDWLDLAGSFVLCMPFSHRLIVSSDLRIKRVAVAAVVAQRDTLYWVPGDGVNLSLARGFSTIANAKMTSFNVLLSLCFATCLGSGCNFWAVVNVRLLQCDLDRIVAASCECP